MSLYKIIYCTLTNNYYHIYLEPGHSKSQSWDKTKLAAAKSMKIMTIIKKGVGWGWGRGVAAYAGTGPTLFCCVLAQ